MSHDDLMCAALAQTRTLDPRTGAVQPTMKSLMIRRGTVAVPYVVQ
jgi:hypothetical protein